MHFFFDFDKAMMKGVYDWSGKSMLVCWSIKEYCNFLWAYHEEVFHLWLGIIRSWKRKSYLEADLTCLLMELTPPKIIGRLTPCSSAVLVRNQLSGSLVEIFADDVKVGGKSTSGPDDFVVLDTGVTLTAG